MYPHPSGSIGRQSDVRPGRYGGEAVRVLANAKGYTLENIEDYRVVDYRHTNEDGSTEWRNTDPKGEVTTDGSREGEGDPPPIEQDIVESPFVNVGFQDKDGEWHYYWIDGPFDEEFWLDDAIEQIVHEYGIVLGE